MKDRTAIKALGWLLIGLAFLYALEVDRVGRLTRRIEELERRPKFPWILRESNGPTNLR